jgi:hypothetical protein
MENRHLRTRYILYCLGDDAIICVLSYLDSRSRNRVYSNVRDDKAAPLSLRLLSAMDNFSRLQHKELLLFSDLFESLPQCDKHFRPIYSPAGSTRYGDDLLLTRCNRLPFDSPSDFIFYGRIRYNGRDITSLITRTARLPDFL